MKTNASQEMWYQGAVSWLRCLALMACALFLLPFPAVALTESIELPKRLVLGGDANYPPFESLNNGKPLGFNVELGTAIGEVGGVVVEHQLADWPDTVRALEAGTVDAVPMFESDQRKQKFLFAPPFFYIDHGIYSRPESGNVASVSDLAGRAVVVEQSSYAHSRIRSDFPSVEMITETNTLAALHAIEAGRAEYAVLASISADRLIRSHNFGLRRTGPPLWPTPYAFAVRKDNVELHRWLTHAQTLLFASGQYEEIFKRWQAKLVPGAITVDEIADLLTIVVAGLVALGAFGYLWSWYLKRAVAARTRELSQEVERRKAAEARIRYFSDHDAHTNLPKLHHFMELTKQLLTTGDCGISTTVIRAESGKESSRKEIAIIRLSDLSKIIRAFGYVAYNDIVAQFAQRLKDLDFDLCGYLGREVFVVFGGKEVVDKNFRQVTLPLTVGGLEVYPQVIWGGAYWPEHGDTVDELIRHAEIALAVAEFAQKHAGLVFHPSMEPNPEDLRLLSDFSRSAGEELYPVFQPQVDLRTGQITGAEALIRWQHPELGYISPGRFVPLLESAGLIARVTERMLNQTAEFTADLRRAGFNCPISVNVSAYDLLDAGFIELVTAALCRYNAKPEDLKLELTETGTFRNPEDICSVLAELRQLGIAVAVDDFGTGYSSLSYLSAFPIQEVKIDVEFVRDMLRNPRHREIVCSTISMVRKLGMVVVAEGAEDEATVRALCDDGCDRVQGYIVSKPLVADDFKAFLVKYEIPEWLRPR